jgi:hypothetical protein
LVLDDGGSEIFCKILLMKISWLKAGSFDEELLMKKLTGTHSLIPGGDVAIMAGNKKTVMWAFLYMVLKENWCC